MPDGREAVTINLISDVSTISAEQWDACAGTDDPFLRHAFFKALEESGSVCTETGWLPHHLSITGDDGNLLAVAPLYAKTHSYGEYVFDWGWADAFERAGGKYYPKLQAAVPFTPVTGRRLLVRDDAPPELADALISGMMQLARQANISSVHVTFPTEEEWRRFETHDWLLRIGQQFHWENRDYATFDDFLDDLASRKRKAIRRERRSVAEQDIAIRTLTGDDLEERHWDAFYRFYRDTSNRKWGNAYLNREFFSRLHETMAEHVVLIMAEADGHLVGGAFNLKGADTLYGRYWGCLEDYKFLHFEACYYRAIDFAIEHGLRWVEAGAQGPHKIQRGYLPRTTYSAHWITNDSFRDAVENHLVSENRGVEEEMRWLAERSPFRSDEND